MQEKFIDIEKVIKDKNTRLLNILPKFIVNYLKRVAHQDEVNEIFYVRSSEVDKLEFLVFDRWGKLIFQSDHVNNGWDGTYKGQQAEAGVYMYSIKMKLVSGEEVNQKGDVTLIR